MTFPVRFKISGRVMPYRLAFPYGLWICDDERNVLFNREYQPIWHQVSTIVTQAEPMEWVKWRSQMWFYDDSNPPWINSITARICAKVLEDFCEGLDVQRFAARRQ